MHPLRDIILIELVGAESALTFFISQFLVKKSNRISKPVEMTIERWDSDKRLNSLHAQKEAIEDTLDTLDDELTRIFWLRWSRGSKKTWEEIACEIPCDRSTIYRKRERILEIMADNYGIG